MEVRLRVYVLLHISLVCKGMANHKKRHRTSLNLPNTLGQNDTDIERKISQNS